VKFKNGFTPLVVRAEAGLHDLCGANTRETRAEYKLLVEASRELRAQLAPHGRTKAWRVSVQLTLASLLVRAALGDNVSTYAAFIKQFGPELMEARVKKHGGHSDSASAGMSFHRGKHGGMDFKGARK
jgi:hypothetical protein